jgi:hypothetical protein
VACSVAVNVWQHSATGRIRVAVSCDLPGLQSLHWGVVPWGPFGDNHWELPLPEVRPAGTRVHDKTAVQTPLLPAGGGCKEFAMRAAVEAKGGDISPFLQKYFKAVAMAEVSRSAEHAREIGYLRPTDRVVMNRFELLEIAKSEARAMAAAGYRPPMHA